MKTVKDLITELMKYPPDMKVVQARDEEGNGFEEWYDIGYGRMVDYEFVSTTYDDPDDFTTEREMTLDESDTICLWP